MISFKSSHYPNSSQPFKVLQESAIRFYAIFILPVMAAAMVKISVNQSFMVLGVVGMILALLMGNLAAYLSLRNRNAEILFVGDSVSLISVHDILYKVPNKSFPLRLANPTRDQDRIQFHYEDRIVVLKRENWEDFDLIWDWVTAGPPKSGPSINYV